MEMFIEDKDVHKNLSLTVSTKSSPLENFFLKHQSLDCKGKYQF